MEQEVEIRKPVEKGVAMWVAGGACDRAILKLEVSYQMGAFPQWLCFGQMDKSSKDCLRREKRLQQLWKDLRSNGHKEIKGREFRMFSRNLGGPGEQFIKNPDFALRLLPFWWEDVRDFARDMGDYVTGVGGAQLGWIHLSSGGHCIPLLATSAGLSRTMLRPAIQMAEIVRPTREERAATAIFREQIDYIIQNDYLGFDGLLLTDNSCADSFRSLKELDLLAAIAATAPLAANPPRSKLHYLEVWDLLTRRGRMIGMWARRIPIMPVGVRKRRLFGRRLGTDWQKDKHALISSCFAGLESLLKDPSTALSGLPARSGGENIYAVAGDISESTFKIIESEWRSHGICLYAPAPRLKNIYLVRLANVDETTLLEDLGSNTGYLGQECPQAKPDGFNFEWIASQLARRADVSEEEFNSMWKRKEV